MAPSRKTKRIAVLTGGGDSPALNAVIRAVVLSARRRHKWEVLGIEDGFEGLIKPDKSRPLVDEDVRGLIARGGTILGSSNRANPFAYVRRPGAQPVDVHKKLLLRARRLGIDTLVVVGGDGTQHIASRIHEAGLPVVGVPKTIDNDLLATDLTFGFNTAVQVATEAIDRLHTTAESHERVMIVEVMGRNAGWIALHAGIAGGAHVILIPEIPYDPDLIVARLRGRKRRGLAYGVVVLAEGAMARGGQPSIVQGGTDWVRPRLGGAAARLSVEIEKAGLEIRTNVLGHVQRGGTPTGFDRVLATRFGVAAVDAIAAGQLGTMVALQGNSIRPVPLAEAVGRERKVDPRGEEVAAARAIGIEMGDE